MPTAMIGKGLRDQVKGLLGDGSRYRLVLYGLAAGLQQILTDVYRVEGELSTTASYQNTGVAATTGLQLTAALSDLGLSISDMTVTTATGETLGPIYFATVVDATNAKVVYWVDYSDAPKQASNGGSLLFDFPQYIINIIT